MNQSENPLRAEKRKKLHRLRELGIDPYPHMFERTAVVSDIISKHFGLSVGEKAENAIYQIAGRVMTVRIMGKAAFFNIQDQSGNLQCYVKTEELQPREVQIFENLDLGDFVGLKGFAFKTKKGELSLHVGRLELLCKSLEPMPEKFHGISDIEIKYRHRHLDLVSDEESRAVFVKRSRIITEIRNWLNARGFMEVETPILQPVYGGAAAHPFTTHHRALDMQLYMRISPELYLKRLIVGGFEKVYDMNRNFRNEGIDRTHNPEFTMLEWYEAYTDYFYQMKQFEDLISHLAQTIHGTTKLVYQGKEMDFTTPWRRLKFMDGIYEHAKLDPDKATADQIISTIHELGGDLSPTDAKKMRKGELLAELFEVAVEPHLWHPTFVMDHPIEISPLTKKHRENPHLVERFEPFAASMEIGNSYTELNDPEDQLARLKEQEAQRDTNEEAHPMDEDFMHAIDFGMPPTGGVGIGIERIVMLLTDRPSIRDILLFPTMKLK